MAIKIGALPWPIIFSVIVSGGILKLLCGPNVSLHEINVAQAGASIGGLMAAGIVFTIPGILYLNQTQGANIPWPNPWMLSLLSIAAGLLGILLSVPLKYTFVDEEKLPYPSGTAGAELLMAGQTGGRQLHLILLIGSAAGVFALLRDIYLPAGIALSSLASVGIFWTILLLPSAVGGGYILGAGAGFSWFAGAVLGWMIIVPVLFHSGFEAPSAQAFVKNLGMGVVLGAGVGFFASYILPRVKKIFGPMFRSRSRLSKLTPWVALLALTGLLIAQVPLVAAIIAVLGVWVMVAVAARMTGETNIDPLEQFGIFVALVIALIYKFASLELTMSASFVIVAFVSIACAIAGDAGHDYKSSAIVGTKFFDIVKVDVITVVVAGLAAPFVLETIRDGFGDVLFTPVMPAPQAQLVAGSIFGFDYPRVFLAGFVFAFFAEIGNRFLPDRFKKLMLMPLGIGLFLGLGLATLFMLGALIRLFVGQKNNALLHSGILIAAGVMGGEGIAGFGAGALATIGFSFDLGAGLLLIVFVLMLSITAILYVRNFK